MLNSALNISLEPSSVTVIDNNRTKNPLAILDRFLNVPKHKTVHIISNSLKLPKRFRQAVALELTLDTLYNLEQGSSDVADSLVVIPNYSTFANILDTPSTLYICDFLLTLAKKNHCAILVINNPDSSLRTMPYTNPDLFATSTYLQFN